MTSRILVTSSNALVTSSFLFLAIPGATSSVLVNSSHVELERHLMGTATLPTQPGMGKCPMTSSLALVREILRHFEKSAIRRSNTVCSHAEAKYRP